MAVLSTKERSADVIAAKAGAIATLPAEAFLELMVANGVFATKIARVLCERLLETSQRMFEFASATSHDRVYAEIVRLSASEPQSNERLISPAPSVTELAARLSMARETASRTLSQLEKMRLLVREPSAWRIAARPHSTG